MKDLIIEDKPRYFVEALNLIKITSREENYVSTLKDMAAKYSIPDSFFKARTELSFTLIKEFKAKIKNTDLENDLRYYFYRLNTEGINPGELVTSIYFLWDKTYLSKEEIFKLIREKDEKEYWKEMAQSLEDYNSFVTTGRTAISFDSQLDCAKYILQMDLSDEEKYKLENIILDKDNHINRVEKLFDAALEVIQGHEQEFTRIGKEFKAYWESYFQSNTITDYLEKNTGFKLNQGDYRFNLYPAIACPNYFSLITTGELYDSSIFDMYLGILFGDHLELNLSGSDAEDKIDFYMKTLKLLSDKSKFDILTILKDKSMYGAELAKHMQLTTATISHHMSVLLKGGLITMDDKDNKVYYKTNSEEIIKALDGIKQILC